VIVADSSVWIDYFNGQAKEEVDLLDRALLSAPVLMGDLILAEVLQGFRADKDYMRAKNALAILPFSALGGYEVALQAAQNYRDLRKRGITVRKTVDMIIATFCIINGHRLLHTDRDFDPMEQYLGLNVVRALNE
jgi:predicted nucleic acid-binding protein